MTVRVFAVSRKRELSAGQHSLTLARANLRGSSQSAQAYTAKKTSNNACLFAGDPYGTRTHVTTVKGWCLNRLTNGPFALSRVLYYITKISDFSW